MYGDDQLAGIPPIAATREAAAQRRLGTEAAIRSAVLRCFCDPLPVECAGLRELTARNWKSLVHWLDISGFALYFLDRMNELGLTRWLPPEVAARLKQNLVDNTGRTLALIAECNEIQVELQRRDLPYAVLKGFSLWPHSVPRLELRSQLDLDFLVAENAAVEARRILEARGYRLQAISGRTWEFKTHHPPSRSLADLYKAHPHRTAELHLEVNGEGPPLLARRETREFHGLSMPVLAATDLFLWQALHAFKHLCGEFARAAYLLEFRRHVIARSADPQFWEQVESQAAVSPRLRWALGAVTLLTEQVTDPFAPEQFAAWSRDRLPEGVRLWIERFGRHSVLADFPGSKAFLLLERELAIAGIPAKRGLREQLLPLHMPRALEHARAEEPPRERLRRNKDRLHFLFFRLRFHLFAGIHYAWIAVRWRRQRKRRA